MSNEDNQFCSNCAQCEERVVLGLVKVMLCGDQSRRDIITGKAYVSCTKVRDQHIDNGHGRRCPTYVNKTMSIVLPLARQVAEAREAR